MKCGNRWCAEWRTFDEAPLVASLSSGQSKLWAVVIGREVKVFTSDMPEWWCWWLTEVGTTPTLSPAWPGKEQPSV